jgi:dCMP deaminase
VPGDAYYMEIAKTVRLQSKDRSRRVGCVIVGPEGEVRSTGYNGFPRGVDDNISSRHERPNKYLWTEHSERNAIYQAARMGVSLKGCTLYTWAEGPDREAAATDLGACADCTRAMIQVGITTLVIQPLETVNTQWGESIVVATQMLQEVGIEVRNA